jgi:hypothetical protein
MSLGTILLIILVLLLIGALPSWPYSAAWGQHRAFSEDSYCGSHSRAEGSILTDLEDIHASQERLFA